MRPLKVGQARRVVVPAIALGLAACQTAGQDAPPTGEHAGAAHPAVAARAEPFPGGAIRFGDTVGSMAEQYTPRAGPYAATGASAWVRPSPAPAYVASGPPPPADPPAPEPAAVANRQPASPPASAAEIVRPEAAQPDAPASAAAAPNAAVRAQGLALFNSYSCGACHVLADAGAAGSIGPSLDRNPGLTKAFAVDVITNGRGAMPAFGGQLSPEEIDQLAEYIVQFSRK